MNCNHSDWLVVISQQQSATFHTLVVARMALSYFRFKTFYLMRSHSTFLSQCKILKCLALLICVLWVGILVAQQEVNYDENQVPAYDLPRILVDSAGATISDSITWRTEGRPHLLHMLENQMFGIFPDDDLTVEFILVGNDLVFDGRARRKQIVMQVSNDKDHVDINLLIYLPTQVKAPIPLFLGLNFYGNHTVHSDEGIVIPRSWSRNNVEFGITSNRPTPESRGVRSSRWEVDSILNSGFGLATIYYGDIDPDFDDGFSNGVHSLLDADTDTAMLSSISAWAWGLSKAMDLFEQERSIDHRRVIVLGHSRLGKTSLWAGAKDERFAMVISNNSGCGGAALSRRRFGETINRINHSFPHWFCNNFNQYNNQEDLLPFDQHSLIALMAPRPVYVASASEDRWADPRGEFMAARAAAPVYNLYQKETLENAQMPDVNSPLSTGSIGYHLRDGKHDINLYDWSQYIEFARLHLLK